MAGGGDASSFVVADVVDDVVAAEVLEPLSPGDHVLADHVVAHHFAAEIGSGLDDALDRLGVGTGHDDDVGRAGLGHHLGFEVTAVHRLEIGDDGGVWKSGAESADAVESLGEDERGAGLEPVDSGAHREGGGFEGFVDIGEIEGNLDDGFHDQG